MKPGLFKTSVLAAVGAQSASAPPGAPASLPACAQSPKRRQGCRRSRWARAVSNCAPAVVLLLAMMGRAATINYWAAPAAVGTGDGSSSANAAYYLNSSFWTKVQSQLASADVTVSLADGNYTAGTLTFTDLGRAAHRLTLQAVHLYGPVFSASSSDLIDLTGSQNIKFYGLLFTGHSSYWGVNCQPDGIKPCRNVVFSSCQFLNLTNVQYGAIGLVNGTVDMTVESCTFNNLGYGTAGTAHFIYASHNACGVKVLNSSFTDCRADYVRFRDDSEYCTVSNCVFLSTMSATAFPFVTSPLYNSIDPGPGAEFFGTYFQIISNSFAYNVAAGTRAALQFSDSGYDPQSYYCGLTSADKTLLAGGSTSFKQSFLQTNMGILAAGIKMFGNTFNSGVIYRTAYTYSYSSSATNAPRRGWQGTIDISDVPDASGALLTPWPKLRNADFDRRGSLSVPIIKSDQKDYQCAFRTWFCSPKYTTGILTHPGFNGTSTAMRFNTTSQCLYQWVSNPTPTWTLDCLFTIGSGFTGTGTKFKVDLVHDDIAGSKVSVGVDDQGRFGIYNGGTFTVLPELGTVAFSVDSNGNGYFNDPGDTLKVYRLRVVGNYSALAPYVNLYTSDANSLSLNHQSLRRVYWVNGAPLSGQSAPSTVAFYNYTAPVVLDQIALSSGLADQPPAINTVLVDRGNLVFSGTNGFAGGLYYVLSSTNPALPASAWVRQATNTFDGTGSFSFTNAAPLSSPRTFYRLQLQ